MAEITSGVRKSKKKKQKKRDTDCHAGTIPDSDVSSQSTSYEEELEWCISQLKLGLLNSKASPSQRKESENIIKRLSSPKTPLPRKRQIMRNTFGDYRAKMKSQPLSTLPHVRNQEPKIECVKGDKTAKFFKTKCCISEIESQTKPAFKFNFIIDEKD